MRILLSMRSLNPAEGGPITAAFGLSRALVRGGHSVTLAAHDDGLGVGVIKSRIRNVMGESSQVDVEIFPRTVLAWELSVKYNRWLSHHAGDFDLVVINSLWISHVFAAARACRKHRVPYVIRPHGCLNVADWEHHKGRKDVYWRLIDRRNCASAAFLQCTSSAEKSDAEVRNLSNVVNIPLGVDPVLVGAPPASERDRSRLLYVGRIAEKKGIDLLIRSVADLASRGHEVHLDILGIDHRGLQRGLEDLAVQLSVKDRVNFRGHVEGADREPYFRSSGIFVLPSKDENFGIAVAEALSVGMPVVITPGVSHAPLVSRYGAGAVTERTANAVTEGIASIIDLPEDDYVSMARSCEELIADNFSWDRTASLLEDELKARGIDL